ncbi:MAG: sulfatase-like hydrolase/transferase [Chitinophagaceae bacterium]|nr:sulfatase-like hydrolase/transferase [Chitinophagaceae bacterium]
MCLFEGAVFAQPGSSKPNIVIIMLDDARYDMFAPNGGPSFFSTPSVNRIADEGVNFKFTGVTTSLCTPSRASIYTGLYAHHHGTFNNQTSPKPGLTYISSILQDNGYKTAFIGKWLLDFHVPDEPIGFDFWAITDSADHDSIVMRFNDGTSAYYPQSEAVVYTDLGINFVENQVPEGAPWALFLFYRYPHLPWEPLQGEETLYQQSAINFPDNTPKYTKNFPSYLYPAHEFLGDSVELDQEIRDYYETAHAAEYCVDTVLGYLEQKQILDSTLIIFSSDNGYLLGEHGMEKKIMAYEESLRVPLFIRYPAWFQAGTVVENEIAANIDIAETLLEAAGIPDTFNMDGVSLHKLAQGQEHRKYFFYENYPDGGNRWAAVRSLQHIYIYSLCSSPTEEFYDLTIDPKENNNLIFDPAYATLIQSYRIKFDSLRLATGDTVPFDLGGCKLESAYFQDADGDQYGNPLQRKDAATPPVGYVLDYTDCNDAVSTIHPMATETCNSVDDNCNGNIDEGLIFVTYYTDADGDGFGNFSDDGDTLCNNPGIGFSTTHNDCNDANAGINPNVIESCNGIDDNCDGITDEGLTVIYFPDTDADGYGDFTNPGTSLCSNPGVGFSVIGGDCNDNNADVHPNTTESCNGIDDNCNGFTDEGLIFVTYYIDLDHDTYGDLLATPNSLCENPGTGYSINHTDCNDVVATINPGSVEICNTVDDDCNGTADDGLVFITYYTDADFDGSGDLFDGGNSLCINPGTGFSISNTDCNDGNPLVNPAAIEICNNIDDNCNGTADDGLIFTTYYVDADMDGFGLLPDAGSSLCINPGVGFSVNHTDCNDGNALINPAALESCNSIDDNCNGGTDEGLIFTTYYTDLDNDGFGDLSSAGNSVCDNPGNGFSTNHTDCNDANPLINPSAVESCNTIDDNCNGTADEGIIFITYFTDLDHDGFGDLLDAGNSLCNNPGTGFSTNNTDCNDANPLINPSALESCNTIDDNCNGTADEGIIFVTYFIDTDHDGFGNLLDAGNSLCNNPGTGFSTNNTDCNDANPLINPSAVESCNTIDDNCNGTADDGLTFISYYADVDDDGFGDLLDAGNSLCNNPGTGFSMNNTDCNDANSLINPSVVESCNTIDDNCNGTADEGIIFITYFTDLDHDGFGDLLDAGNSLCNNPGTGFSTNNTDCNDANSLINPSVVESCNTIDDNCNGTADED